MFDRNIDVLDPPYQNTTMINMQGFSTTDILFGSHLPQDRIFEFYRCLNTDYKQFDWINVLKKHDLLYPPVKLNPLMYNNQDLGPFNLCGV